MRVVPFFFLPCLITGCMHRESCPGVACLNYEETILTHQPGPSGPVPTAFDPNGVYPYVSYSETSNRPVLKNYRFVTIENDHLKATICPDLGGKLTSIIHKQSGREVLYKPEVIRPVRILPRFYFVAGGIEVSFPISHSPSQNEKVLHKVDRTADRVYVSCGERELRFGMQWSVEYSLGPDDAFLTERVVYHNPGSKAYPWMSWSNAALPSAPDTEFHYPGGTVLSHSSKMDTIDWEQQGPRREADILEMTGYFWQAHDVNAFGVFTPSMGSGLYHIADPSLTPGMKLWSYGNGEDREWAMLSTAKREPYVEIQAGPIIDQSIKRMLSPGETQWHAGYWIPVDRPLNIYTLPLPEVKLRPVAKIPRFEWAREEDVRVWQELTKSFRRKKSLPEPPEISRNNWAPSGMENLDPAFKWAIQKTSGDTAELWKYYYGTWQAGRGDTIKAIEILSGCRNGLARALLGRLLKLKGDVQGAADAFQSIEEPAVRLHPQVVVERDRALRDLGDQTLQIRENWLKQVDALEDEGILERKIQLLMDKGEFLEARNILLSHPFQKVHQSYTRTGLWRQVCHELNEPPDPVPQNLGEDRLAGYGVYREY